MSTPSSSADPFPEAAAKAAAEPPAGEKAPPEPSSEAPGADSTAVSVDPPTTEPAEEAAATPAAETPATTAADSAPAANSAETAADAASAAAASASDSTTAAEASTPAGSADAPGSGPRVTHHTPPGPSTVPSPAKPPVWPEYLKSFGGWIWQWLVRPRVRLTLIGLFLLLLGVFVITNSFWTLPLVIGGGLMVIIAWVGSRLAGQFAVEWGETGTELQFRAKIKSSQQRLAPQLQPSYDAPQAAVIEHEPADAEVVEGEAHTVEIDVEELKALIAAVEAQEAGQPAPPGNKVAALRVPKHHRRSA